MKPSKLSDHTIKKGRVVTPWNRSMGETFNKSSWSRDRVPEYLWLALILKHHKRSEGLRLGQLLLEECRDIIGPTIVKPKFSAILSLPDSTQDRFFNLVSKVVAPSSLAPLSAVLSSVNHATFYKHFYLPQISLEERISILKATIWDVYPHQSNEATDVRFLVTMLGIFQGKILFNSSCKNSIEAFKCYPITDHEDDRMRSYRPSIRAMEVMDMDPTNEEYVEFFWRTIGMRTECELFSITCKPCQEDFSNFIADFEDILEYLLAENKDLLLSSTKFVVMSSMAAYAKKLFAEVFQKKIGTLIAARSSLRTIIEILIMLKYLEKNSLSKPEIWEDYKKYGVSKYKLVLLKARETPVESNSHLRPDYLDGIVNEDTWEEFTDIDLRYFDQSNIREKSVEVDEKALYDLFYDYDSSFSHGLWGAIREGGVVKCNNPAHQFHLFPDFSGVQACPDVLPDMFRVLKKVISFLDTQFPLPEWFVKKYLRG